MDFPFEPQDIIQTLSVILCEISLYKELIYWISFMMMYQHRGVFITNQAEYLNTVFLTEHNTTNNVSGISLIFEFDKISCIIFVNIILS